MHVCWEGIPHHVQEDLCPPKFERVDILCHKRSEALVSIFQDPAPLLDMDPCLLGGPGSPGAMGSPTRPLWGSSNSPLVKTRKSPPGSAQNITSVVPGLKVISSRRVVGRTSGSPTSRTPDAP